MDPDKPTETSGEETSCQQSVDDIEKSTDETKENEASVASTHEESVEEEIPYDGEDGVEIISVSRPTYEMDVVSKSSKRHHSRLFKKMFSKKSGKKKTLLLPRQEQAVIIQASSGTSLMTEITVSMEGIAEEEASYDLSTGDLTSTGASKADEDNAEAVSVGTSKESAEAVSDKAAKDNIKCVKDKTLKVEGKTVNDEATADTVSVKVDEERVDAVPVVESSSEENRVESSNEKLGNEQEDDIKSAKDEISDEETLGETTDGSSIEEPGSEEEYRSITIVAESPNAKPKEANGAVQYISPQVSQEEAADDLAPETVSVSDDSIGEFQETQTGTEIVAVRSLATGGLFASIMGSLSCAPIAEDGSFEDDFLDDYDQSTLRTDMDDYTFRTDQEDYTLRTDQEDYTFRTDLEDDTLRTYLEDDTLRTEREDDSLRTEPEDYTLRTEPEDGTLRTEPEDSTLRSDAISMEEIQKAIATVKKHASRLGVTEAELFQQIHDDQGSKSKMAEF